MDQPQTPPEPFIEAVGASGQDFRITYYDDSVHIEKFDDDSSQSLGNMLIYHDQLDALLKKLIPLRDAHLAQQGKTR